MVGAIYLLDIFAAIVSYVLELAILGTLKEQDLHGYELKRRLTATLGAWSTVSFGSLYPALRRLERAGAVEVVSRPAPRVPMTGSLGGERAAFRSARAGGRAGRRKKVYAITESGQRLFEDLLSEEARSPDDGRGFDLRLIFARHLSPEARLRMLERRREELLQRLARQGPPPERLDSYARSLVEHTAETTERDISWLDRLIATERGVQNGASPGRVDSISKGER